MERIDGLTMSGAKPMPAVVVFSADGICGALSQAAFESYLPPEVPHKIVFTEQSEQSIALFPKAFYTPKLLLIENSWEDSLLPESFLALLMKQPLFADVPYIILRYSKQAQIPEGVPAPICSVDIRRDGKKLIKAVIAALGLNKPKKPGPKRRSPPARTRNAEAK